MPGEAPQAILVGDLSAMEFTEAQWSRLLEQCRTGSTLVFLAPAAFRRGDDPLGWLPLDNTGYCYHFHDWVYHKECVARPHPIFAGLQGPGVLDWEYYDQLIPHLLFADLDTPDDIAAVAFTTGYQDGSLNERFRTGYAAGLLFAGYRYGDGWCYLNTFPLLEHLDHHPTADHMLMNIINWLHVAFKYEK